MLFMVSLGPGKLKGANGNNICSNASDIDACRLSPGQGTRRNWTFEQPIFADLRLAYAV